jgi:membrane protease subunit (stomatin/prohibitin family)
MAIIDLVKWEPGRDQANIQNPVYAWRFPQTNLSTYTQLIVAESQEAVLFSKGRMMGKFGPGKHTLHTENLPLLRELFGLPFGGKNPFTAEVWFVNKLMPLNIDWLTDAMRIHDADYKVMVPLIAKGRYGLKITDAERFLVKLVGTAQEFNARMLTDHFNGALVSKTKTVLSQAMQSQNIGVKSISAYLEPLSESLKLAMRTFWEEYGFELIGFYVTSIDIDDKSEDGRQILKAMTQQSAQSIAGYTWQQSQTFQVADKALGKGGELGIMGAMMMTGGLGGGGGGMGQELMRPQPSSAGQPGAAQGQWGAAQQGEIKQVFCSNCSKKFASNMRFCPHCGDEYTPCPRCATDNDAKATRCVTCGLNFAAATAGAGPGAANGCSRCGTTLAMGAKFCPNCGQKAG